MESLSFTEENYLKTLYHLIAEEGHVDGVGTSDLAIEMKVAAPTVSDMARKLKKKDLIVYQRYKKLELTLLGKQIALGIIRRHRLWETFLYDKLGFSWDEVHEVAEQLEHIQSYKLVEKLDQFLGKPKFDPHGDPIPGSDGKMATASKRKLSEVAAGDICRVVAVKDNSALFLQYVSQLGIGIDLNLEVVSRLDFDDSIEVKINGTIARVSKKAADNILIV